MKGKYEKTAYLTLLSVISMIAVVILHANGCFWAFSTDRYWVTANCIESVFYFAVPIFFMISGATLLDYRDRYDTRVFVKKRALKTVIPFLFWSVFGLLFRLFVTKDLAWDEIGVVGAINGILNTQFVDIYWFFNPLFVMYAFIPLVSLVPKEKKTRVYGWAALVLFCTSSLIPFFLSVFHTGIHWPLDPGAPVHYLLFLFLGYYLSHKELSDTFCLLACGLGIIGLLAHILGTYYLSVQAGGIVGDFKGYLNLPSVLFAVGIFVFFKRYGNRLMRSFLGKPVRAMASYSFTVYLLHWFMLRLIQKVFMHYGIVVDFSLWYRLGAVVVIVPASMLIAWIVRKIPLVRGILPS